MTEPSLSLYITDIEAFLKGDRDYSMSVYCTDFFAGDSLPPHWIRLQGITIDAMPTRENLIVKVLDRLDKEEQTIIADREVKLNDIKERKQQLLALPQPGDIDD